MAQTYDFIATQTLGGTASTVVFSSIPATYTDLELVCVPADTTTTHGILCRLNSDSGNNYSRTNLFGNGTTATSTRETSATRTYGTIAWSAYFDTTLGNSVFTTHFMNYSNTTTNKTWLSRGNIAAGGTELITGLWQSTAAINSITIYGDPTASFKAGSTFTLHGIKAI